MDSRERFRQTMGYGSPDRVPYFHEGMEEDVIQEWRRQGLSYGADLNEMFRFDRREEFEPDLEALPGFRNWPSTISDLDRLQGALNPNERGRLPKRWNSLVHKWRTRNHPLFLRVHRGFFLSMRRCRPFWRRAVSSLWRMAGFARISRWKITSITGASSRK
jgi:hypothetical protein